MFRRSAFFCTPIITSVTSNLFSFKKNESSHSEHSMTVNDIFDVIGQKYHSGSKTGDESSVGNSWTISDARIDGSKVTFNLINEQVDGSWNNKNKSVDVPLDKLKNWFKK